MVDNAIKKIKSRIWRRIVVKGVVLLLWAAGMAFVALQGDGELTQSQHLYMGVACVGVFVVSTLRDVRRLRDEEALRRAAIEESDERNTLIAYRATRLAVTLLACLFPVVIVVLALQGMQETINTLAYTMCAFGIAYWASWFYVARKC